MKNPTISMTIPGEVPEKNFVLHKGNDGEIKQIEGVKSWEYDTRKGLDVYGWTSQNDPRHGEYTPLHLHLKIYSEDDL